MNVLNMIALEESDERCEALAIFLTLLLEHAENGWYSANGQTKNKQQTIQT